MPLHRLSAGQLGLASTFAALGLVALVPAVCILWFMSVAMRNERLAVQERLTDVYLTHLASLRSQLSIFWAVRPAALAAAESDVPAQRFAALVRDGLADSVVVYAAAGKPLYPAAQAIAEVPVSESAEWSQARELEFQKKDLVAAAEAYGRIAALWPGSATSGEPSVAKAPPAATMRARALQAQAACLLKAGQTEVALGVLANLTGNPALRCALNAQGALIVPNAQLLMLRTLRRSTGLSEASYNATFGNLVQRLNDYSDSVLSPSQRRFLMREVQALAPDATRFPTLAAEELAAAYLEHDPAPPKDAHLERSPLAGVWRLPSADRTVVALFREDRLCAEMAARLAPLALPDVRVTVLPPGETTLASRHLPPQDAGELLPGWRLALSFRNGDPLAEASARQTRLYLWTGFLVVLTIALLAWLVARYVAAQMRLARLKNELVSAVSHELKTPLASIRALVDTLSAERYHDKEQLREYLQLIARENLRLTHLIENFLTFSRLERGKERFHFQSLVPEAVVAGAVAAVREKLQTTDCRVAQEIAPNLPRLHGDADALTTVLVNLLDNACKYTGDEKRIALRVYAANASPNDDSKATNSLGRKEAQKCAEEEPALLAVSEEGRTAVRQIPRESPGVSPSPNPSRKTTKRTEKTGAIFGLNLVVRRMAFFRLLARFFGHRLGAGSVAAPPRHASLRPWHAGRYTGDPRKHEAVVFEVEDNGIGLAPEEIRRIFDRFYQVDQSLTRQRGGCGLGLSIVKFIVEAHRGTVEVASTPGQGSTFRVRIPVETLNV